MAFVNLVPVLGSGNRTAQSTCSAPMMVAGEQRVGRRAALQLFALGMGLGAARAVKAEFDLEELKEDLETIKYDEEVTDEGPTTQSELITRTKKPEEEPEFKKENAELLAEEEEKFQEMVKAEKESLALIKAKFGK